MPNIRRQVSPGDHIFVVSGKIPSVQQTVMGGFEVAEKLESMHTAFDRFPALRLHRGEDGQLRGNIIVTAEGKQHPLDTHKSESFQGRIKNYIVGRAPVVLRTAAEIAQGRVETLPVLREVLGRDGRNPINVIGRWSKLEQDQILWIRDWLEGLKIRAA
jgi:hypothetical protein